MQIHITKNHQRMGPYTKEEVQSRLASGKLNANDLAWYEGLPAWVPVSVVVDNNPVSLDTPPLPSGWIEPTYAGFWKRCAAWILDMIILMIPILVIGGVIWLGFVSTGEISQNDFDIVAQILGIVAGWLYWSIMESSPLQATLGKLALGIKVTDSIGERLSFGRASGRHFGKFLSSLVLGIGWIMAGFTRHKQTLHDIVANCLVVRK
jgi:uncharacterized RDD family membrane protein YckC